MNHIALTGPMYAGKSTLARALEEEGYMLLDFPKRIKIKTCAALEALGHYVTVAEMEANKAKYRELLQALGPIEFNVNPVHVMEVFTPWIEAGRPRAVFDNVRGMQEYHILREQGFTIIGLRLGFYEQVERAKKFGVSAETLQRQREHILERGLSPDLWDATLDATESTVTNVQFLMSEKEYSVQETK